MARPGVTYDDIVAAIQRLQQRGESPSIQKIRDELGSGSPNTILKHLSAWRALNPGNERQGLELPESLMAAVLREISRQREDAVSGVRAELVRAEDDNLLLARAGEQLEQELSALKQQHRELELKSQRLAAEKGEVMQKLEAESITVQQLQEHADEQHQKQIELQQLVESRDRELKRLQVQLEDEQARRVEAERTMLRQEGDHQLALKEAHMLRDHLRQAREDYQSQLDTLKQALAG